MTLFLIKLVNSLKYTRPQKQNNNNNENQNQNISCRDICYLFRIIFVLSKEFKSPLIDVGFLKIYRIPGDLRRRISDKKENYAITDA